MRELYTFIAVLFMGMAPLFAGSLPQRIISLSPNLTEILYDLGVQDRLVGDTDFCDFPPAAKKKERVGGWIDPNFEKIISLKPDLVLVLPFHDKAILTLKKLHVPVLVVPDDSIQQVLNSYTQLGKALGCEKRAQAARRALEKKLAHIQARARGQRPLSVLFVVGRTPGTLEQMYGVGTHNFMDELIHMAGGVNVLSEAKETYPLISKESLLRKDPEVIIESEIANESSLSPEQNLKAWDQMPGLRAVRDKHLYYFRDPSFVIPGPGMVGLGEFLCDSFQKARRHP